MLSHDNIEGAEAEELKFEEISLQDEDSEQRSPKDDLPEDSEETEPSWASPPGGVKETRSI